ncbi:hypothetical protein [Bradyrhizobium sp. 162]|uniref:hypothetical protein n=1 Tax=Bradyrhizobium sp. 162 TaxID=2782635 RepID=UPI001FFBEE27|nr:hypothetical protein [Bradyrhizobium sp. 162]MCK1635422.1 hypothetical protein [Bradyrhizobium sp. 162]
MSGNTDLESRVVAAIRQYRAALTRVEDLEREESCAHRALTRTLVDLGRAINDEAGPYFKGSLFEIGAAVIARSDEARNALVEATAQLESARLTLAALERQLGYIPEVSMGTKHE